MTVKIQAVKSTRKTSAMRKSDSIKEFERFRAQIVGANAGARIAIIRGGVNAVMFAGASEYFNMPRVSFGKIIGIAAATADRKIKNKSILGPAESERLARVAVIEAEAENVFGTAENAKQWLLRKNHALGDAPLSLLDTETGANEVRKVLNAIAYGGVV